MIHDLILAVIAAAIAGGGGGGGYLLARRRRGAGLRPAAPARPASPATTLEEPAAAVIDLEAPPDEMVVEAAPPVVEEPAAPEAPPAPVGAEPVFVEEPIAPVLEELRERPRLRDRLGKARSAFGGYLSSVRSRDRIDESTWEELEEALILADVGAEVALELLDDLRSRVRTEKVSTPEQLITLLRDDLVGRLEADRSLRLDGEGTNVWLFVGVNGVGKTTTIGKLGLQQRHEGRSVVMAAGDTFRAAAADQLAMWAARVDAEVVRGNEGGDPGAVIFDAVQHAAARHADLVLADTAGRLHNKVNLMEELKKVRRVAERPPGRVSEVLLVLDATTGQNGLTQAKQFASAVGVTGVVLTKLDGTAKGGIALAVQTELGIPVKLVGVGERPEDLVPFDPVEFVDALVSTDGVDATA